MSINSEAKRARGLHRVAVLLAGITIVLLIAGALVTSNEAGDSVPDWPLSFGRWLIASENFTANVRYEYSHRFIAGVVGVGTALLMVLTLLLERRSWLKKLAIAAAAGVVLQALIGGVRVHFPEYKALIAVPHALGGVDADLGTAAAGHADVAGELRQIERAAITDLDRLRELVDLLGALARFGVALEPRAARMLVD